MGIVGGSKVSTKLTILKTLAQKVDHLFVGGGIAPKMLAKLSGPLFMHSFVGKGRMQPLLETMPGKVIINDKAALMGAARCAAANGSV